MVLKNDAIGTIKRVEKAKVLENYAKSEEAKVEDLIKATADSGAKVIVSGAGVGEMTLLCAAQVTIVRNEGGNSASAVVLRGSTDSIMDDLERAVDDCVNAYMAMCRDSRIIPGGVATELSWLEDRK